MTAKRNILPILFISVSGGSAFCILEFIYRGYSHWTMLAAGGICTALLYVISVKSEVSLWKKWICGMAVITCVEFFTGVIVNIKLGWNVWDYSNLSYQILGQICLVFCAVWFLLSIPVIALLKLIHNKFIITRGRYI